MDENAYSHLPRIQTNLVQPLAPVFMDDALLVLPREPKPAVSELVAASGRPVDGVRVVLLANRTDANGKTLRLDEVIDRTIQAYSPLYLKCFQDLAAHGPAPA